MVRAKCRVLLVDDDEDDYVVTRDFLVEAEQFDFQLDWVDNFQLGLQEISKNQHDVYLLDYRLGKENGLELLQEAIKIGCNKPIVLLTGLGDHEIDQQAMKSGASDYLEKGHMLSTILLERAILHAIDRKQFENRQLELMSELATANQELKDFAYIVSHDLKAPLRGIASIATWIEQDYGDRLDSEGQEMLHLLGGRVRRMSDLIDGILQYSRVGRVQEEKSVVNLQDLLIEVIDLIALPVGIEIAIETELPMVFAGKTQMQQVFQNLLSNAVKYMGKPEGKIRLGHTERQGFWEFYVSDTGLGIEARHFDKIFQIFQTLTTRDSSESTGVGLAIVKKIIEIYGGKIWVASEYGKGSTFFFTIPRLLDTY
ncbi:hybrid sensor histidine kinase/response regulator [Pseudanabaena sp. Chao 1811]|uniref:hybrid sensor histidine kinase/response regulator n=1 Tax=Pseudanabaena sp. Chao 1811 TaxID=2963092 RepID=UPI0022F3BCCA|nr:hybrid sensor histidine kinase/response regulator [Pseudanabaena sp. Chao 1811]